MRIKGVDKNGKFLVLFCSPQDLAEQLAKEDYMLTYLSSPQIISQPEKPKCNKCGEGKR